MLFLIFVAALTVAYLGLGILAGLGYDPARIELFETIHYYGYVIVFGLFMVDFVCRVGINLFLR
jgi:hypothetical protein